MAMEIEDAIIMNVAELIGLVDDKARELEEYICFNIYKFNGYPAWIQIAVSGHPAQDFKDIYEAIKHLQSPLKRPKRAETNMMMAQTLAAESELNKDES